ncbi:hypothetical protein Y032_0100g3238 [Ancylostoma ceylanicum]|nr:hypothetical protein Y032_0100g3238 [Ancylostoma ceylanicum]
MGEVIDWAASEPPNRYVLAFGTNHCLVEQDYDHNIYEECSYVASRTLIKCRAVRKKSDLKENGGICELHKRFQDSIRNRFGCEGRRLMQDSGQGKPKYTPLLNQDGIICEEYPWLIPSHRWESPLIRSVFDESPDDDTIAPLRNAGVFTDKDILRMRKALLEKRIEFLKLHGEMTTERAWRQANELLSKNGKLISLGSSQAATNAACCSIDDYGVISKRIKSTKKYASGQWTRTPPKLCSFGRVQKNDRTDAAEVNTVVQALLDCVVSGSTEISSYVDFAASKESTHRASESGENKPCSSLAVPLSKYCISHQMLDERQLLFVPCSICHSMCTDIHTPPLCEKHLRDISRGNRIPLKDARALASPAINLTSGVPPISPNIPAKPKTSNDPTKPLFGLPSSSNAAPFLLGSVPDRRVAKRLSVDVHSKEEAELLAKRFKAEVPAELTVAEALKQGHSPAVIEAVRRAELRRTREDEVCTCARIRPFERSQFPPKQSLPRRVNNPIARPSVPLRRPTVIDGGPLQQPSSLHTGQTSGRLPSNVDFRQIVQIPQRRPQPPHRVLSKDGRPPVQYSSIPATSQSNETNWPANSSSTSFTVIDEAGNEVLVEDRRTPPPTNERGSSVAPHTRPPISSYRRQVPPVSNRQQIGGHRSREGDGHRHHSALHPPPDPPIIPLSRVPDRPTFGAMRGDGSSAGVSNANQREVMVVGGRTGPIIIPTNPIRDSPVQAPRTLQSDAEVPTTSEQLAQASIRQRFPTILRKAEAPTPTPIPTLPPPPVPPSNLGQQVPPPKPPPSSRPLPPHRLISAPRPVPPHRLIKSLPLPTVPPPRAHKVGSESSSVSNTPEPPKELNTPEPPKEHNTPEPPKEQSHSEDPSPSKQVSTSLPPSDKQPPKLLPPSEKQLSQEKMFVEKDMDPLSILAAVSEAARDGAVQGTATKAAAAAVQKPVATVSEKDVAGNDDEDEEYEEEL